MPILKNPLNDYINDFIYTLSLINQPNKYTNEWIRFSVLLIFSNDGISYIQHNILGYIIIFTIYSESDWHNSNTPASH